MSHLCYNNIVIMICTCKTHTLAVAGIGTTYLTCRVNLGKFPKAKLFTVNVPSLKYRFTLYGFLSAQLLNQLNVCLNSLCHYLCSLHCILQCIVFKLPHPCYSMDVMFGVLYNIVQTHAACIRDNVIVRPGVLYIIVST